jgi:hypothetical protein
MDYEFALTDVKVEQFTLSKADQAWFSGYIHELCEPSDTLPKGTSSFVKGRISCILENFKVPDKILSRYYRKAKKTIGAVVSSIQCSKEIYTSRTRIVSLIREKLYQNKVLPQELLKSTEQLREEIKISVPFNDTKIFLTYERDYFTSKCDSSLKAYNDILSGLNSRKNDIVKLHRDIDAIRGNLRMYIEKTKQIASMRSAVFFPAGKKKSDQAYRLRSLEDKVSELPLGKFTQLMDIGKLNSRLTWTKPSGDTELRNPQSPFYVSLLNIASKPLGPYEKELVRSFSDSLIGVVQNVAADYDNSQQIIDASNRCYGRMHEAFSGAKAPIESNE